ncbi:MAG: rhomboid family intramembrane serine protease [Deltaproteobacteria bacterium]|nr:rhomboid family intramembrane serine protease [Deltaproteobacteria bacterium]
MGPRICPKCGHPLTPVHYAGVRADHCTFCKGIWLDKGELARIEGTPTDLPDRLAGDIEEVHRTGHVCPSCGGRLVEREFVPGTGLWIDQCKQCGGLWFDSGELMQARSIRKRIRRPVSRAEASRIDALRNEWQRQSGSSGTGWRRRQQPHDPNRGARLYLFQLLTGLPVEVDNPVSHFPYMTIALVAINALVFFYTLAFPGFADACALVPAEIFRGEHFYTLLTSMFIHGGIVHILGNMYFLWIFGDNVEDVLGPLRYLLFYIVCGIAAGLSHTLVAGPSEIPLVGASGAIAGVMGAYMFLFRDKLFYIVFFFIQFKIPAPVYLLFWVGWQLLYATMSGAGAGGVAWWAHIGGFTIGAILTYSLKFRKRLSESGT